LQGEKRRLIILKIETPNNYPGKQMGTLKNSAMLLLIFTLFLSLFARPVSSGSKVPFFFQKWENEFSLRSTENGDTLSIGAVFSTDREIFIYNQAAGAMVVLDSAGKAVSWVLLEGFGRGTYRGDDFVAMDSVFIFVNNVDKRLEYFDRYSGKRLPAVPLPLDALNGQAKRANRLINRIFVVDNRVFVGNEHVVFDCGKGLKKTVAASGFVAAPGSGRFGVMFGKTKWIINGSRLTETQSGKKATLPQSHFTINGKRLFVFKNKLFSIQAAVDGVSIIELK
jgi:hypothetical protein